MPFYNDVCTICKHQCLHTKQLLLTCVNNLSGILNQIIRALTQRNLPTSNLCLFYEIFPHGTKYLAKSLH